MSYIYKKYALYKEPNNIEEIIGYMKIDKEYAEMLDKVLLDFSLSFIQSDKGNELRSIHLVAKTNFDNLISKEKVKEAIKKVVSQGHCSTCFCDNDDLICAAELLKELEL